MKVKHLLAVTVFAAALATDAAATAQTTTETKVSTETGMTNGVPTKKTRVESIHKHKTGQPKKILGIKVGQKTRVSKTVKETTTDANGDKSTTVTTKK